MLLVLTTSALLIGFPVIGSGRESYFQALGPLVGAFDSAGEAVTGGALFSCRGARGAECDGPGPSDGLRRASSARQSSRRRRTFVSSDRRIGSQISDPSFLPCGAHPAQASCGISPS